MKQLAKVLVILMLILGLGLTACAPPENTAVETDQTEVTTEEIVEEVVEEVEEPEPVVEAPVEEEVVEEPVEEVVEEEVMEVANLDGAFTTFLTGMEAYNTIGIEDLNVMMAEEQPYLLDVRQPGELEEKGWIEGAVNIPLREVADNIEYLPSFDTPIVSYCGSGWRCTIALTALEAMGWEDVYGLKGGSFGGWIEAGYPIAEGEIPELVALNEAEPDAAMVLAMQEMLHNVPEGYGVITAEDLNTELVENPKLVLIDVRRPDEVDGKGHIDAPNVLFVPLEEFVANQDLWPEDTSTPIVTYCGSGHRSTIAMPILWSYGFENVRSLKGGYGGWAGAGFATVGAPEPEADPYAKMDAGFATFLADMEKYNTIGIEDMNVMLAEDPPFILDVRQPEELEEKGWIEGAVNIPLREVADNIEYLPSFDTPIISYCGSGWRCTIALAALEGLGWENVLGLKGGSFGGWVEAGYPIAEGEIPELVALNEAEPDPELLAQMQEMLQNVPEGYGVMTAENLNTAIVENPDLILIDVRRAEEVEEKGHIDAPNVTFIPLEEFIASKEMWPEDKDAPIVVYCGSGHRSTIAMAILWAEGYTDVHSLKGGFGGWAGEGYATVGAAESADPYAKMDAGFATFLADMETYNTIGIEDMNVMLAEDPPFILDVRQPEELLEKGWIEGAVNIPLREVADNIEYLPSFDTTIISYCGSGWRCTIALAALEGLGWENVLGLKGGSFGGWVEAGYPIAEGEIPELVALNEAEPDPELLAQMQTMLQNVPEGYGVMTAENLNTAIVENPDLILIDVRRAEEVEEKGSIDAPNVLFIPLEEFIASKEMWPEDKEASNRRLLW